MYTKALINYEEETLVTVHFRIFCFLQGDSI